MGDTHARAAGPDPGRIENRADLVRELDLLRARAAGGSRKPRVSLAELAGRVGEPRSTVHAYVVGRHLPASDVLDRIVIALGATQVEQREWSEAWFRVAASGQLRPKAPSGGTVPHQLPPDVDNFTGRSAELADLDRCLDSTSRAVPALVISALAGSGGVGKSALAARWAHQVADRFPDGQLWVNLRGYDTDQPLAPSVALAALLRALGVADADIPADVEERSALYRSLLDGRQLMVVLDNARDTEQVRLLLPGTASCLVVVTSRDSLAGLVARHGARRIELDVLPEPDAIERLGRLIGERARSGAAAVSALVERCGRLPLALRIAGELAVRRPAVPLGELAAELADEHHVLDVLDAGGDQRTSVRTVLSWSYRHCDLARARAFRLLGLVPGPDIDAHAAAALIDTSAEQARRVLVGLTAAHLVGESSLGRYTMHDLLHAWAAEKATTEDAEPDQRAALTRLFDHYLHTASVAMDLLYPHEGHRRPLIHPPVRLTIEISSETDAQGWLDAERPNLVTMAAAHVGWPTHAIRLSALLERHLTYRAHHLDAQTLHTHALAAARAEQDLVSQVRTLIGLGIVDRLAGRYRPAEDHLRQALALARVTGDRRGEARALGTLGHIADHLGRDEEATRLTLQALQIFRAVGDRMAEALAVTNLGALCEEGGRYEEAIDYHRRAVSIARDVGDKDVEARALNNLGVVFEDTGQYQRAADNYQEALTLHRALGDQRSEALALTNLGEVWEQTGECERAVEHHLSALELFRGVGERNGEARALNNLGTVYRRIGDPDQAERHWRQALAIYDSLGLAEAGKVRAALAAMQVSVRPL